MTKKLKEKKIAEFYCRASCRSFLHVLLTESRFIYRNVIPLCKLLIILCSLLCPFPLFIVFKLSFKTTFNSVFFPFYVILYRIRKEHYSSTYLLLYHCAND